MAQLHATSRRDFLKQPGSLLTASAVVGGGTLARSAHAGGSDQIKIALIGCGGRGVGAARNCLDVRDNIKLVAVADAFEDNARRAAESLKKAHGDKVDVPAERVFFGFDAYQKAIGAGVDLVLLVTPPGFRPLHYRAAVEAGKHVFMEKPVCVDAPGFRSVQETNRLAEQKGLKIAVGLNMRHTPSYQEVVRRVHDGAVGPISFLRCYGSNADAVGTIREHGALAFAAARHYDPGTGFPDRHAKGIAGGKAGREEIGIASWSLTT